MSHAGTVPCPCPQSLAFAAFCAKLNIPAAMCAVTLLNRLRGDQVRARTIPYHTAANLTGVAFHYAEFQNQCELAPSS
jgi:hypothetical protein